jgi:hypothetical protein
MPARRPNRYGRAHRRLREIWAPRVAAGLVACVRCGERILPGRAWDLDHSDDGRGYQGPAHARCNRRAGAVKGNALRRSSAHLDSMKPGIPYWLQEPKTESEPEPPPFLEFW